MAESAKRSVEWNQNLERVKNFASSNGKWPSTMSKDPSEKSLAQWWSRQKYFLGKNDSSLSPERAEIVKQVIDSYGSFERDGVWETRYNFVIEKYKKDGKLWPYSTKNEEEQKSIRWWNQQKTFARKFKSDPNSQCGGMTQDRFSKIEALMRVMGQEIETATPSETSTENNAENNQPE